MPPKLPKIYSTPRTRRSVAVFILAALVAWFLSTIPPEDLPFQQTSIEAPAGSALEVLEGIETKGRAPKTGYARSQFGNGWGSKDGCTTRNIILYRDLTKVQMGEDCQVMKGRLDDPYTGIVIFFQRGPDTSTLVQIDHVIALSNAWQTGAQKLSYERRVEFANDPINLLAVDGPANQQKGDSDAASWLPSNKPYRCAYVARQVGIKAKYDLYMTSAEKTASQRVLSQCPDEPIPTE